MKIKYEMLRKLTVYLMSVLLLLASKADTLVYQDSPEAIVKKSAEAIEKGDVENLTRNFFKTVEIDLLGDENFYSQAQSVLLLRSFFEKNIPVKFTINHQGAKDLTAFAIGTLQCKNGLFRISIFLKTDQGKTYIHQFRIEPETAINPK
ncbi:DUF4783 domain-containing protein [Tenuifilum sp.]|uniref:DUF4783 domain-containing protein n=1 Tax=Tenuifilum sp. TaxID=2760880 RepID=UPI002C7DC376|nr:DUF4783 domain-containing protein [Tenuifilum sp.]